MSSHVEKEVAGLRKQLATRETNLKKLKQSSIFTQSNTKNNDILSEIAALEKRLKCLTEDRNNCTRARAAQHEDIVKRLSTLNMKHNEIIEEIAEECSARNTTSKEYFQEYTGKHRFVTAIMRTIKVDEELTIALGQLQQLIAENAENKCLRKKYVDLLQNTKNTDVKIPSPVNLIRPKIEKLRALEKKRQAVDALQSELDITF